VIVPNVTFDDQIVCQTIPLEGVAAETMWFPPS
jgi:hypothetical protein